METHPHKNYTKGHSRITAAEAWTQPQTGRGTDKHDAAGPRHGAWLSPGEDRGTERRRDAEESWALRRC